eukprot:792334-Pyramimonas_sp.AAC.1
MEPITEWDVRKAAHAMKANTGLGADRMTPIDVERLPSEALVELAELPNANERTLAWPHQAQLIIGKLLPKKMNGDRAIGLASFLGRVWSLIREGHVRQRRNLVEAEWDAAIAGNASPREGFHRTLQEEVAGALGTPHGHGLMDVQGFYDSIEWGILTH